MTGAPVQRYADGAPQFIETARTLEQSPGVKIRDAFAVDYFSRSKYESSQQTRILGFAFPLRAHRIPKIRKGHRYGTPISFARDFAEGGFSARDSVHPDHFLACFLCAGGASHLFRVHHHRRSTRILELHQCASLPDIPDRYPIRATDPDCGCKGRLRGPVPAQPLCTGTPSSVGTARVTIVGGGKTVRATFDPTKSSSASTKTMAGSDSAPAGPPASSLPTRWG